MSKRYAWEINWLRAHGWSQQQVEQLLASDDDTPVEYLTGWAEFAGLPIQVDTRVLIPRVETEKIAYRAIESLRKGLLSHKMTKKSKNSEKDEFEPYNVVEVGTGSGCLALAIAKAVPSAYILALDISQPAVLVAKNNVQTHRRQKQIQVRESNLLQAVKSGELAQKWILLANLPYIPTADYQQLSSCVKDYEPRLALDGGADGALLIRQLLTQVGHMSQPPTLIGLEVDPSHDERVVKQLQGYIWQREKDEGGYWRYWWGHKCP